MNSKIKNLGLAAILTASISGCSTNPGNNIVIKSGTAGELNQTKLTNLANEVSKISCAKGSNLLESIYKTETPGVPIISKDEEGNEITKIGKPIVSYNIEKCMDDSFDVTFNSYTGKVYTVQRLIDFNTETGKLGVTIPTPSMWNRPGTSDESRYELAEKVSKEIPSDIVMASLVKMNSYGVDDLVLTNWYRDMKNDAIALVVDGAIFGLLNSSGATGLGDKSTACVPTSSGSGVGSNAISGASNGSGTGATVGTLTSIFGKGC